MKDINEKQSNIEDFKEKIRSSYADLSDILCRMTAKELKHAEVRAGLHLFTEGLNGIIRSKGFENLSNEIKEGIKEPLFDLKMKEIFEK